MYDNICKILTELFPEDIASWLLEREVRGVRLEPSELQFESIRADLVFCDEIEKQLIHCEFQTRPVADMPLRMLEYYARLKRRYPEQDCRQIVVYLDQSNSPLVFENCYRTQTTIHYFEVIHLWELPAEKFMTKEGLLPFAVLGQGQEKEKLLETTVTRINEITSSQKKGELLVATSILAGLILDGKTIQKIMGLNAMRESVIYQQILAEGREEGWIRAKENLALKLLTKGYDLAEIVQLTELPAEHIERLRHQPAPIVELE